MINQVETRNKDLPNGAVMEQGSKFIHYGRILLDNVVPILVVFLIWEIYARYFTVSQALFPTFSGTIKEAVRQIEKGIYLKDVGWSLYRVIVSMFLGIMFGTIFGLILGYIKVAERWLIPVFQFFISIPGVAVFPIAVLWFGLGEKTIVGVLAFEAAITIAFTTWTGVRSIPVALVHAARSMGINGFSLYFRILIPAALPSIITGYRLGFSRVWRVLVAGEMISAAGFGLGFRIFHAQEFMQTELMFAGVLTIGILGLLIERLLLKTIESYTVERWGMVQ